LDVLGVHGKLVKYVVHLSKRKKLKKIYFSSHKLPKQQLTIFWSQGILAVKKNQRLQCQMQVAALKIESCRIKYESFKF
jgi:hypothetical protein